MKLTVLLSSCGRRVQLLNAFRADARDLGIELRVVGCDSRPEESAAALSSDRALRVPPIRSDEFLPSALDICRREAVDLIVPTIDPGIPVYATHFAQFREIGAEISVSSPEVATIAGDKIATYHWLSDHGMPTPLTIPLEDARRDFGRCDFPVMAKPVRGSASAGIRIVTNAAELFDPVFDEGYLVQEFIKGTEYTVNLFFDLGSSTPRCVVPHRRIEVRSGEVSKGVTLRHPALEALGWKLGTALGRAGARGAICFQVIESARGELHVIEINARFGGGYPLAHRAGARFSRWLMEERLGLAPSWSNDWRPDVFMTRFDDCIYVER